VERGDQDPMNEDREEPGRGTGRQGPWAERDEGDRANKQPGDPYALDVEGDPRGGVQSDEYRHADPRDLVEEGLSVEERRARDREEKE
jgi:hypothetical protein